MSIGKVVAIGLVAAVATLQRVAAAEVAVTSVTAQQRYPWNGLVDVTVTLQGSAEDIAVADLSFVATNSATKAAIPVEHITLNGRDTGSGSDWTRQFIWDAQADVGAVKIDEVALTVDAKVVPCVQLWENGPYWAECNVGASKPEEYGYYFWWGDTVGYKRNASNDGWVSVKDGTAFSFTGGNCPTYGKSNSQLQSAGYIDSTGNLVAKYDAATAHLGGSWRMPTDAEFSALINNCTATWTTRNGVAGRLVTGKGAYASKSIFLPAAGDGPGSGLLNLGSCGSYWSSTTTSDYFYVAWCLDFHSSNFYRDDNRRDSGQSVRPIRDYAADVKTYTVKFNANGGSGTMANEGFAYGTAKALTANAFVRSGYEFQGWAISASGAVKYQDKEAVSNLTSTVGATFNLYAVWLAIATSDGGVQLWENGPYWAECNVGASKPEGYGYYFWWGDTVGYKRNESNLGWVSMKDGTAFSFSSGNCPTYGKSNSQLQSAGYVDSTGSLVAKYDAATAHLGAPWRMPTDAEFSALINNCTTTWTTRNGVNGRLVTGKGAYASKSIFLPAAGYGRDSRLSNLGSNGGFWSSTPYSDDSYDAWDLCFSSSMFSRSGSYRYYGQSVRPVRGFAK